MYKGRFRPRRPDLFGKRRAIFPFVRALTTLVRAFDGLRPSRPARILIDCPAEFHFWHIRPVVELLASDPSTNVTVIRWPDFSPSDLPAVRYVERDNLKYELLAPYDLYLTTEFDLIPWWFSDTTTAFFLHGVGPKVSYFATPKLQDYDRVLAPGPYVAEKQRPFARSAAAVLAAGLPILDQYVSKNCVKQLPCVEFPVARPLLVYAPSWSADPEQITVDVDTLDVIATQQACNCVIRPHPRLMDRRAPRLLRDKFLELERDCAHVRLHTGPGTSVYDLFPHASVFMSDISSVLYEFLVLDRPILLHLKDSVADFYGASDIIEATREAVTAVSRPEAIPNALEDALGTPGKFSDERRTLCEQTLYNVGTATKNVTALIKDMASETLRT